LSDFKYHRVSSRFWTDEKTMRWDDDTRLLALYLLTCPHRTTEGLFRLPKPYIAADLGWSMERLEKPFAKLLADGFIKYDETVSVMLLPNALKYNPPENTNQAIRAARAVAELPETPLLREFQRLAEQYSERLAKQLANCWAILKLKLKLKLKLNRQTTIRGKSRTPALPMLVSRSVSLFVTATTHRIRWSWSMSITASVLASLALSPWTSCAGGTKSSTWSRRCSSRP